MSKLTSSKLLTLSPFWCVFIFIYCFSLSLFSQQKNNPAAQLGLLDLSNWDIETDGMIPLNGSWKFYWNELYNPADYAADDSSSIEYFTLPKLWNNHIVKGEKISSNGYATFQLTVTGNFNGKNLALTLPDMYSSYNLWIDGKLIAHNGVPGTDKESTIPQWIPYTKTFNVQRDTISILLNISNFHHKKGGIKDAIWLGTADQLLAERQTNVSANLIQIVGLLLLFALSMFAYFHYKRNKIFIFFSLFSLTWAIRGLFTNMYLMNFWFPEFSWTLGTKTEYLTLYITLLLGVQIVGKMYAEHANKLARYISHLVNGIFILITLFAPTKLFSQLLNTYFIFAGLFMAYIVIVIMNALINDKRGAGYLSLSILVVIFLFFYDLFSFQQLIPRNPYIISFGYLIMYYINGLGIWYRLSHVETTVLSSDYTYQE